MNLNLHTRTEIIIHAASFCYKFCKVAHLIFKLVQILIEHLTLLVIITVVKSFNSSNEPIHDILSSKDG
uniref:Uncharacterized protein n=1 Tax=Arundo donax TaxID=35708 RepID=A0A0A9TJN5_ARUDO